MIDGRSRWWFYFWILIPIVGGCTRSGPEPVVVYCSHDANFAEALLDRFTAETGIPVNVKYDTEATKSTGLVNLLIAERDHPRCDVFWNNQVLGTVELQRAGVLAPCKGTGFGRIPAKFKDAEGHWAGFAARLRVYIVNTNRLEATETAIADRLTGDLSRMAIAKPLYGTTLTHYSLLWHTQGSAELQAWHQQNIDRGQQIVGGNAQVKDLVAAGVCDFGWTDTDDYFAAADAEAPVAMLPIRVAGATISIPNSVALIRNCPQPENAARLIDFLLSAETELALAQSASRQIPLGEIDESQLSEEVRQLRAWAAESYDLSQIADAHHECLEWLKQDLLR